jgi:hypothetical protein
LRRRATAFSDGNPSSNFASWRARLRRGQWNDGPISPRCGSTRADSLLAFGQRVGYLPLNVAAAIKLPPRKDTPRRALVPASVLEPLLEAPPLEPAGALELAWQELSPGHLQMEC